MLLYYLIFYALSSFCLPRPSHGFSIELTCSSLNVLPGFKSVCPAPELSFFFFNTFSFRSVHQTYSHPSRWSTKVTFCNEIMPTPSGRVIFESSTLIVPWPTNKRHTLKSFLSLQSFKGMSSVRVEKLTYCHVLRENMINEECSVNAKLY